MQTLIKPTNNACTFGIHDFFLHRDRLDELKMTFFCKTALQKKQINYFSEEEDIFVSNKSLKIRWFQMKWSYWLLSCYDGWWFADGSKRLGVSSAADRLPSLSKFSSRFLSNCSAATVLLLLLLQLKNPDSRQYVP